MLTTLAMACTRTATEPAAQRYELKGIIVSFDKGQRQVVISHQDVPGLMEGMTMGFTLKDESAYDVMKPGDHIQATLVVAGARSWLENPIITEATPAANNTLAPNTAIEPQPGAPLPEFALINQDSKPISLQTYRGHALLITFIYTRCPLPDFCTRMSNNFAALNKALTDDAELRDFARLLSVTLDPAYDTPKVLRSYGAAHTEHYEQEKFERWELATGRPEEIKRLAEFCGLTYMPDGDQIVHSLRTALVGPDGKLVKIYRGNEWKPEDVLNDLRLLRAGKSIS
ncbi:MAG: SCO family protein [Pyrinomonadaceae bacterium]